MKEIYRQAARYGASRILRLYSGYPQSLPLPVSIQHGWTMATNPIYAIKRVPENWYWSVAAEQRFTSAYRGIVTRTSGAPFLYLLRSLSYLPLPKAEQKGSIVFPSHSIETIDMVCDFDLYAAELAALPMEYQPITVCLYYSDYNRGLAEPFLRHGMPVVTNGQSRIDDDFLWNFIRNVHGKRHIFSNQMSSSLLFGVAMNLTAHFWGPEFQIFSPDKFWKNHDYSQYHRRWEAQYKDVFRFPDPDLAHQKEVADQELGRAQMLSPNQMRRLLWRLTFHSKYHLQFLRSWARSGKQLIREWSE